MRRSSLLAVTGGWTPAEADHRYPPNYGCHTTVLRTLHRGKLMQNSAAGSGGFRQAVWILLIRHTVT